jgi:hypothetical protein
MNPARHIASRFLYVNIVAHFKTLSRRKDKHDLYSTLKKELIRYFEVRVPVPQPSRLQCEGERDVK